MKRLKALLTSLALVAGVTTAVVAIPAGAAFAASCPDNNFWYLDSTYENDLLRQDYVNLRSGPSTSCAVVTVARLYHYISFDCYKEGVGGTWTHLTYYVGDGYYTGWIRDDLLMWNGSHSHCPIT